MQIKAVSVFCGAKSGNSEIYKKEAESMADVLSRMNISLVYGGAKVGLMGVLADRMLQNGGKVIGVIPQKLMDVEIAHPNLTEMYVVNSLNERKIELFNHADAFIMLPGGCGSLDEFFDMFTMFQVGYHTKPCCILNTNGYYDHLLGFLDHAMHEGFLRPEHRSKIIVSGSPDELLKMMLKQSQSILIH